MPSYYQMSVKAIAMELWKEATSSNGTNGSRNVVRQLIFDSLRIERLSRSLSAGQIKIQLRGQNTFATHGAFI
jgi:hypothetical protein